MLTKDEKNYLAKIPADKEVFIKPFDQKTKKAGDLIVLKIKKEFPNLTILFIGATALGVIGQNDIDIYALPVPKGFGKYLPTLERMFGKPAHIHETIIEWHISKNECPIELYLTDPDSLSMQRQIKVFNVLKNQSKSS